LWPQCPSDRPERSGLDLVLVESGGDNLTTVFSQPWPTCRSSLGRFSGVSLADVEAAQAELWKAWSPQVVPQRVAGADPHTLTGRSGGRP